MPRSTLFAAGFLVACTQHDATVDQRILDLEHKISEVKEHVATVEMLAIELSRPTWWCDDLLCFRSEHDCATKVGMLKAQPGCSPSVLAFCTVETHSATAQTVCYPTIEKCADAIGGVRAACMGVR